MNPLKIAILDMYNNFPNQGMRCIHQLIEQQKAQTPTPLICDVFNVRAELEIPSLDYDIYISSGGPGSPLPSDEAWEAPYFDFIDRLFEWNRTNVQKKRVLLICHSFQLVSRHLGVGTISKRKSTSFGIFPIHETAAGRKDPIFQGLNDPFMAVDSRDYQVTKPDAARIKDLGVKVLALEKARPHVPLERAIMALRFTDDIVGTQFHPEADSVGMLHYMLTTERREQVIETYGEKKYNTMVRLLKDPEAIERTNTVVVPTFLRRAIEDITSQTEHAVTF